MVEALRRAGTWSFGHPWHFPRVRLAQRDRGDLFKDQANVALRRFQSPPPLSSSSPESRVLPPFQDASHLLLYRAVFFGCFRSQTVVTRSSINSCIRVCSPSDAASRLRSNHPSGGRLQLRSRRNKQAVHRTRNVPPQRAPEARTGRDANLRTSPLCDPCSPARHSLATPRTSRSAAGSFTLERCPPFFLFFLYTFARTCVY